MLWKTTTKSKTTNDTHELIKSDHEQKGVWADNNIYPDQNYFYYYLDIIFFFVTNM